MSKFGTVLEVAIDPSRTWVYEQGWQSFSPSSAYRLDERPHRPVSERNRMLNYRQASNPGAATFFSEGVMGVDDGLGCIHVVAASDPWTTGVRIRSLCTGAFLTVQADGPTETKSYEVSAGATMQSSLRSWAAAAASRVGISAPRPAPTAWCSWYQYYTAVSEEDVLENLAAINDLGLPVDVVQIDDGYEAEIGDWLIPSSRFAATRTVIDRILETRRAGIWIAPFLAGSRSVVAAEHPDWLLRHPHGGPVHAGHNWQQDLYSLDLSHPEAAEWMRTVLGQFVDWGVSYVKADFLAAGAIPGVCHSGADPITAYRSGLQLIRDALGPDVYLLGCGAPVLPSVGIVDALRVSADTDSKFEPEDGDMSSPSQRAAMLTARGRQFANGVLFTNDPDCLIARPEVEQREGWARHIEDVGGTVTSSDRLLGLDDWGLATSRRLLEHASAASELRDMPKQLFTPSVMPVR